MTTKRQLRTVLTDLVGSEPPPPPALFVTGPEDPVSPSIDAAELESIDLPSFDAEPDVTRHESDAVMRHARTAPSAPKTELPKPPNRAGSRRHPYPTKRGPTTRTTFTVTVEFAELLEELTPSKLPLRGGERMDRSEWVEAMLTPLIRKQLERARAQREGKGF